MSKEFRTVARSPVGALHEQLLSWSPARSEPVIERIIPERVLTDLCARCGFTGRRHIGRAQLLHVLLRREFFRHSVRSRRGPSVANKKEQVVAAIAALHAFAECTPTWSQSTGYPGSVADHDFGAPVWALVGSRFGVPSSHRGLPIGHRVLMRGGSIEAAASAVFPVIARVKNPGGGDLSANDGHFHLDGDEMMRQVEVAVRLQPDLLHRIMAGIQNALLELQQELAQLHLGGPQPEGVRNEAAAELAGVFNAVHAFEDARVEHRAAFVVVALQAIGIPAPTVPQMTRILGTDGLVIETVHEDGVLRAKRKRLGPVPPRWDTDFDVLVRAVVRWTPFRRREFADIVDPLLERLGTARSLIVFPARAATEPPPPFAGK